MKNDIRTIGLPELGLSACKCWWIADVLFHRSKDCIERIDTVGK